jgi:hypothetical protein
MFLRVGCPDQSRDARRLAIRSERVFPALLIPDPDGFLYP